MVLDSYIGDYCTVSFNRDLAQGASLGNDTVPAFAISWLSCGFASFRGSQFFADDTVDGGEGNEGKEVKYHVVVLC